MVQDIIIRQAVNEDAEGVCRVVHEAFAANVAPENSKESKFNQSDSSDY